MELDMQGLARALNPADTARMLERITQWPWVITITHCTGAATPQTSIHVVQSTLADLPDATDLLPPGAELLRADVLPATRFDDMTPDVKQRYREQYKAFREWRKARAMGKTPEQMVPHVDYDPIAIDEAVERWLCPGLRYAGD